ncbi:MAG: hypothetical protein LBG45_02845 [Dysgonamonadaceae bacterium]|jgi:hypothetical protein|nr:hypothetical protein [Dysgonamonadaceae bacterium]
MKMQNFFPDLVVTGKTKISSIIYVILSVCLSGILFSCNTDSPDGNDPDLSELTPPDAEYGTVLVSKAVQKSFHAHYTQASQVRAAVIRADNISYLYETIKVGSVSRYTANPFSVTSFNNITELYMADFEVAGPDVNINDNLLIIKYADGEYGCLLNSGDFIHQDISNKIFSSHKQLTDSEIVKESTYPYYNFFIRHIKSEGYYFGVTVMLFPEDTRKDEPEEWFPLNNPDEVNANDMYLLDELLD